MRVIDATTIINALTLIATTPPAMKAIESDAWSNPRTWAVVVFLVALATWREWFGVIKRVLLARKTTEISDESKDKDKDRTLESSLFQHVLEEKKAAQADVRAQTTQTIATLQETIKRLQDEMDDIRAERDQVQVDLKVEMRRHEETRGRMEGYRSQRNQLKHIIQKNRDRMVNTMGTAATIEIDEMLELADEASSIQTGES